MSIKIITSGKLEWILVIKGIVLSNSFSEVMDFDPGLEDSPPISIISAPSLISFLECSKADSK